MRGRIFHLVIAASIISSPFCEVNYKVRCFYFSNEAPACYRDLESVMLRVLSAHHVELSTTTWHYDLVKFLKI